jgi:S-adenosylmethionine:tRNA ribosyltransferase-isomerase
MPELRTSDFDYYLPPELIAQTPIEPRDQSRLMVVDRGECSIRHRRFYELPEILRPGDVLVMNSSRVIPARLYGRKIETRAKVELLLLRPLGNREWEALVKPGRRLSPGTRIEISSPGQPEIKTTAEVKAILADGVRIVAIADEALLPALGHVPLPPYIHTRLADANRYQTVYAREAGSAAAPTAGLHFTPELLAKLAARGIECLYTTLHIGLDTFRPVEVEDPAQHHIHREYGVVSAEVADSISRAKAEGRRIICVGTTPVRLLEYTALHSQQAIVAPFAGWVDLLILPGFQFRVADAMLTNFHLPRSTLVMLVSALAGAELIKKAYDEAIKERYRFYSFGDAMLIF